MRKIVTAVALAAAVMVLGACGSKDAGTPSETEGTEAVTSAPETAETEMKKAEQETTAEETETAEVENKEKALKNADTSDTADLVTDAYSKSYTYTGEVFDQDIREFKQGQITVSFRLPQINLSVGDAQKVNQEIHDKWYAMIDTVGTEISQYGSPYITTGMYYKWAVNGDVLSLIAVNDMTPEEGATQYLVYNLSVSTGRLLTKEEFFSAVGLSEAEYTEKVKQALDGAFMDGKEDYVAQMGADEFFNAQRAKTASVENAAECMPYINSDGQLCVVGKVYAIAGGDYYWWGINVETSRLIRDNKEDYAVLNDISSNTEKTIGDCYREILSQTPTEGNQYCLYDIDKNGVPEMLVGDGRMTSVYSFDGANAVSCGDIFSYANGLYQYDGNGIVVHDGGQGSLHLEYVYTYKLVNGVLEGGEDISNLEEDSYEELKASLSNYTPLTDFHPVTDTSYLPQ